MRENFRTFLCLLAVCLAGFGVAAPVWAQDERCAVPMADWQPRDAVRKMAEDQGWLVDRIKVDDGCYEVFARDGKGNRFEVAVNPATLEIMQREHERGEHEDDEHEHDGDKQD
jgi:hypothetical protein